VAPNLGLGASLARDPEIAVAIRTFGNNKSHEGVRVKAGTRFAVGKPAGDLKLITAARYRALASQRLVAAWDPKNERAIQVDTSRAGRPLYQEAVEQITTNRRAERLEKKAEAQKKAAARPTTPGSATRAAARRRTQDPNPAAPQKLNVEDGANPQTAAVPRGSRTGAAPPSSSSPEDQASNTSARNSKPRGTRRA
jgi:hypothetical protein